MFQCDMKESAEKRVQINEADEVAFKEMLAYLYTGHCTLPMRRMARPLLQLADKVSEGFLKAHTHQKIRIFHYKNGVFTPFCSTKLTH